MSGLSGQRAIVVGGSSGIGLAVSRALAEAGAEVVVAARDPAKLEAAGTAGPRLHAAAVDAGDPGSLARFFAAQGAFDHLVLSFTSGKGAGPFRTIGLDELRQAVEGKTVAYLATMQAALPTLRADGSMTLVTAVSARAARPGTAGLAVSNGGLNAVVPVLARELAPLRVNAVCPGVVDTPWWAKLPDERRRALLAQAAAESPLQRTGTPEEIAQAIAMVVANGFITGAVVDVDGGIRL